MSVVKSFSVGNGDMFYINHGSDNFTVIDCYYDSEDNWERICNEIKTKSESKGVSRFISTHPDEDHIGGLNSFDEKIPIVNFYCVRNEATKKDESSSFEKYCELRDSTKAFYLYKGCTRKWMNKGDNERDCAGINCLWPVATNENFRNALRNAKAGESPNNISPIITYSIIDGTTFMWMGDLESDFQDKIKDEINWPVIDVLFAPHHGRDSGKVPSCTLEKLNPQLIVIGEAPSDHLHYYSNYITITQNSAGDIEFVCDEDGIHIYVSNPKYKLDGLAPLTEDTREGMKYIGSLEISSN